MHVHLLREWQGEGKTLRNVFHDVKRGHPLGNEYGLFVLTKPIILILLPLMQNGSKVYFQPILLVTNHIQQLK